MGLLLEDFTFLTIHLWVLTWEPPEQLKSSRLGQVTVDDVLSPWFFGTSWKRDE